QSRLGGLLHPLAAERRQQGDQLVQDAHGLTLPTATSSARSAASASTIGSSLFCAAEKGFRTYDAGAMRPGGRPIPACRRGKSRVPSDFATSFNPLRALSPPPFLSFIWPRSRSSSSWITTTWSAGIR